MDLRAVRYFMAVAEAGSFTEASRRLGVAQSALSRQLTLLEADLKARLLHRHGRGVELTDVGLRFLKSVSPVVRDLARARDEMRAGSSITAGTVSVGMGLSFATTIGEQVVERFMAEYSSVRLRLDLLVGILDPLDEGSIDMAIASDTHNVPALHSYPLFEAPLYLMGNEEDLARLTPNSDVVHAQALEGLPLVLLGHRRGLRHQIDIMARACGFTIEPVLEMTLLDAIVSFVRGGIGFTVLPFSRVSAPGTPNALAVRRIVRPTPALQFDVSYSRHRPRTLAMREMERIIREETRRAVDHGLLRGALLGVSSDGT